MKDSIWTNERVAAFQRYCDLKSFSYAEIAARLTTDFQISFTRNMCIGKAGRMGIVAPFSHQHPLAPAKRAVAKVRVRTRKPRMVKTGFANFAMRKQESLEYKLQCVEIVPRNLPFLALEANDCRYPYGDDVFTFCGHPKREGSSYCTPHFHLTRQEPRARRLAA